MYSRIVSLLSLNCKIFFLDFLTFVHKIKETVGVISLVGPEEGNYLFCLTVDLK